MSLASILKKIDEDAAEQSREIIAQANTAGEEILRAARMKAEEEAAQILRHAEEELALLQRKQTATTVLRLRKERLDGRQQILDKVFAEVAKRVNAFDDELRLRMYGNILLSVREERKGSLMLSKNDAQLVNQEFVDEINAELERRKRKLRFSLSKQSAPIEQGFLIDFKDFDMNYSVEMLLSSLWEGMKAEVSTRLFGAE